MFPPLHIHSKASQNTYGTVRTGERETRDRENCGERLRQTHHSGFRVVRDIRPAFLTEERWLYGVKCTH